LCTPEIGSHSRIPLAVMLVSVSVSHKVNFKVIYYGRQAFVTRCPSARLLPFVWYDHASLHGACFV